MGKIRVKTIGDETLEAQQKEETKKRSEAKKLAKAEKTDAVEETPVGATEAVVKEEKAEGTEQARSKTVSKYAAKKKALKAAHSKKYQKAAALVDPKKIYSLSEALDLLPTVGVASFDETTELHLTMTESGISGTVSLPHGTGKTVRVVIADEAVIADILKGNINFDILLAEPSMMPKLAKVARVLGPKGMMPNPKNGTITTKPEEAAKKFAAGQMHFKTELKAPLLHLIVGKVSFGKEKLSANIKAMVGAIPTEKVKNVTLKSTMSPAIRLDITTV